MDSLSFLPILAWTCRFIYLYLYASGNIKCPKLCLSLRRNIVVRPFKESFKTISWVVCRYERGGIFGVNGLLFLMTTVDDGARESEKGQFTPQERGRQEKYEEIRLNCDVNTHDKMHEIQLFCFIFIFKTAEAINYSSTIFWLCLYNT